jgi:hypothetical protein
MSCGDFFSAVWILVLSIYALASFLYLLLVLIISASIDLQLLTLAQQVLYWTGMILSYVVFMILVVLLFNCCCKCANWCKLFCCFCAKGDTKGDDYKMTAPGTGACVLIWVFIVMAFYITRDDHVEAIYEKSDTLQSLWMIQCAAFIMLLILGLCVCICSRCNRKGEKEPLLTKDGEANAATV